MTTVFTRMASPVGELLLAGDGRGGGGAVRAGGGDTLSALWIDGQRWAPAIGADWSESGEAFEPARRQLSEYFAGSGPRLPCRCASAAPRFRPRCGAP